MKKIHFILLLATCITSATQAQIERPTVIRKKVTTNPVTQAPPPAPAPAPAPARTAPPPATKPAPVFSLTGVVVKIRTGADNKESPSEVILNLYNTATGKICFQHASPINTLFDAGSELEFRLVKFSKPWVPAQEITNSLQLSSLQTSGIRFDIGYSPNFFMDAWSVRGVTITLEFKDQYGSAHPTLGNKVIHFNNAIGMMDQSKQSLKCYIDGNLNALNATIN
ncbi:MAG: hypothetical protein ACTHMC_08200 [Pseudobacter sp.]|uniref:hypothetical protein n=1 Tax=Pseudobacter sp. TaxID=2045420 RepID=UPI003F7F48F4